MLIQLLAAIWNRIILSKCSRHQQLKNWLEKRKRKFRCAVVSGDTQTTR